MKRIAVILVVLLITLACAPLNFALSKLDSAASTVIATVSPTPADTSVPVATDTSEPTVAPTDGPILFSEDFSIDKGNWPQPGDGKSHFSFSKGEYHIQAFNSEYLIYTLSGQYHTNYVMSIDLRHIIGNDQSTGGIVIWRYQDPGDFFDLVVMDDGSYYISRCLDYEYGFIKLPAKSPWLNTKGKTNKVTIVVHDNIHEIYFNDHYEFSFKDSYFPLGNIGLGALPSSDSEVEVAFDNLKIYKYNPANGYTPASPELTPTPEYQSISWKQLTQFLADDHTNWHEYDLDKYNCMDFAIDLVANARSSNINAKIVTVQFVGQKTGHAFVAFETSDRGTVFVEPQGDNTYSNVEVGNDLCDDWGQFKCMGTIESVKYFGECNHAQSCTVLQ